MCTAEIKGPLCVLHLRPGAYCHTQGSAPGLGWWCRQVSRGFAPAGFGVLGLAMQGQALATLYPALPVAQKMV